MLPGAVRSFVPELVEGSGTPPVSLGAIGELLLSDRSQAPTAVRHSLRAELVPRGWRRWSGRAGRAGTRTRAAAVLALVALRTDAADGTDAGPAMPAQ